MSRVTLVSEYGCQWFWSHGLIHVAFTKTRKGSDLSEGTNITWFCVTALRLCIKWPCDWRNLSIFSSLQCDCHLCLGLNMYVLKQLSHWLTLLAVGSDCYDDSYRNLTACVKGFFVVFLWPKNCQVLSWLKQLQVSIKMVYHYHVWEMD